MSTTELIPSLRGRIDELDTQIIALVEQRAHLSKQVQQQRIAGGGLRLELGREREILATYSGALGESGTALADAVLRTCRGAL